MTMITSALEALWIGILTHLFQTTAVLVLLFPVAWVLRSAPARYQHVLWWVALLKLLLPVALVAPVAAVIVGSLLDGPFRRPGSLPPAIGAVRDAFLLGAGTMNGVPRTHSQLFFAGLTLAWAVGASVLLVRWTRLCRRQAAPVLRLLDAPVEQRRKVERALERTGVPEVAVVLTLVNAMPAVRGLLSPRIVLPVRMVQELEDEELRGIVAHEEAHRRRRDSLLGLVPRLAFLLFYYYPPLWLVARRLRETAEVACDERALRTGIPPAVYSQALARSLSLGLAPSATAAALHVARPSLIRRRFQRISNPWRYTIMPKHRIALAAAILVVAAATFVPVAREEELPASIAAVNHLASRDVEVMARFDSIELEKILQALAEVAGFRLETHGHLSFAATLATGRVPLRESLITLADEHGLRYEVPDPDTLVVYAPQVMDEGIVPPELLPESRVFPIYPKEERQKRIEGKVVLQVVIRSDGSLGQVVPAREVEGHPAFTEAATNAVRQWRYKPALKDGMPVDVHFAVMVEFSVHQ